MQSAYSVLKYDDELRFGDDSREFTARDPEGNLWSFGTYRPS